MFELILIIFFSFGRMFVEYFYGNFYIENIEINHRTEIKLGYRDAIVLREFAHFEIVIDQNLLSEEFLKRRTEHDNAIEADFHDNSLSEHERNLTYNLNQKSKDFAMYQTDIINLSVVCEGREYQLVSFLGRQTVHDPYRIIVPIHYNPHYDNEYKSDIYDKNTRIFKCTKGIEKLYIKTPVPNTLIIEKLEWENGLGGIL